MSAQPLRQLHADAMRNSEKILRATSEVSVLTTLEPGGDGWRRRYVALALDGISTAEPKRPLPPAVPLVES